MATAMRAAARSAKFAKLLANRTIWSQGRRTYLSAQYSCDKEWEESTKSDPILQNIDTESLFVDVSRRIAIKTEKNLGLDIDILVNSLNAPKLREEVMDTLNRFRRSKHSVTMLPATGAALVRYYLRNGFENELIRYFEDRANYGIFPDTQTLNIMLDHFLKRQMFRNAAKVAVHLALQEDHGNQISKTLSMIACERYLSSGEEAAPWKEERVVEKTEGEEEDDDDEIQYVRVPNITNPWFDDHFDLTDPNALVGKALLFFGRASEGVVRDSAVLIGLARWQKWDRFRAELAKVKEVSKDTKSLCLERIAHSVAETGDVSAEENAQKEGDAEKEEQQKVENAIPDWVGEALSKLKTSDSTLFELLEADAKKLGSLEEVDMGILKESFLKFAERRKEELVEKNWQIERRERFQILKQKKLDLLRREELFYAFENWNKIEMILKEVEAEREETTTEEKEYIPAAINARHRAGRTNRT